MDIDYRQGHVKALDGVRGIAMMLVFMYHCLKNTVFPYSFITGISWVGLDLFFVLSGFLITGNLLDKKGSDNYLSSFLLNRTLRILPLYFLVLTIFFLILLIPNITTISPALNRSYFDDIFYYLTCTPNILFAFTNWPEPGTLNHFWSLAVEIQFYFIWPFVIMYVRTDRLIFVPIIMIAIALATRNLFPQLPFSNVFTLSRIDALGAGSLAAIMVRRNISLLNKYALPVFLFSLAVIYIIAKYTLNVMCENIHFIRYGYTFVALLFAALVVLTFDKQIVGKIFSSIFENAFFRFIGKYSYGIYVYHFIFYIVFYVFLEKEYSLSKIFVLPFFIFIVLISIISYHLYEKRFLKYKFKIDKKAS